jgi:hypothetical protein
MHLGEDYTKSYFNNIIPGNESKQDFMRALLSNKYKKDRIISEICDKTDVH